MKARPIWDNRGVDTEDQAREQASHRCANCGRDLAPDEDGLTHIPETFSLPCAGPRPAQANDLLGFLRARLVEQLRNGNFLGGDFNATPARLQAGVDLIKDALVKMQRIDAYVEACEAVENVAELGDWSRAPIERAHAFERRNTLRETIEQDALPFASHPEYDESWRP